MCLHNRIFYKSLMGSELCLVIEFHVFLIFHVYLYAWPQLYLHTILCLAHTYITFITIAVVVVAAAAEVKSPFFMTIVIHQRRQHHQQSNPLNTIIRQ